MESLRINLFKEGHEELRVAACDASRCQFVFATSCGSLLCFSLSSHQICWTLPLLSEHDLVKDSIVGLEFMMDNEVLVVGTESGELLSVSVSAQSVEVVGKVEGGIVQMSSSPDGEFLAIVTGLGMLLLMTSDWEVFYEITLDEHNQPEGTVTNTCRAEAQKPKMNPATGKLNLHESAGVQMANILPLWVVA